MIRCNKLITNLIEGRHSFLVVLLLATISWSEADASSAKSFNRKPKKDTVTYDFLYIGSKYQNQFAFLGRNFGQQIPFVTGDLTYYLNNKLWVSASAYKFMEESIPFQTSLTAGYRGDISKRVDFNLSGGQFFIQSGEGTESIDQIGFYQGGFGVDWTILYSTLQAQVMAYSNQDIFLVSQHSRYFEFNDKLFNKIGVSFQPMFTIVWGTSRFYYSDDPVLQNRGIVNPRALARRAIKSSTGSGSNNGSANSGSTNPGQGQGKGKDQGNNGNNGNNSGGNSNSNNGTGAATDPEPVTDLPGNTEDGSKPLFLSWEFALPLSFQWGNFTLECTSRYAAPLNVIAGDPSRPTFIQSFDLYYSIPVKRKKKIRI